MADEDKSGSENAPDQSSTEAVETPGQDPNSVIEDLRKRQSGADKARDTAIAERDRLAAELAAERAAKAPKADDKGNVVDVEALKRELRADFDKELAERVSAEQAKALDAQFPEARKRFPEVIDPAKLVELENYYGEAPTPVGNNAAKAPGQKRIEDMSIAELRKDLDGQLAGTLGRS